jgi:hypothetical protein
VIVTDVFALTGVVVIVKVPLVVPAAIVTLPGTCATEVLLLCKLTTAPELGAAPVKVTVPVELAPPTRDAGVLLIEDKVTATALILRVAVRPTPSVAVIVAEVLLATANVLTVKVLEMLPAGTVTEAGTVATAALLLDSVTMAPPDGAGLVRVTVPVARVPPTTVVGVTESDVSTMAGGAPP